jgi:phenylpropionate dioxygenase-like ring-hydroxylating dioxygenase large terminal subunit
MNYPIFDQIESLSNLSKCMADADQAYCLPPVCYVDERVLQFEIDRLFFKSWVSVGRADRVSAPGDYITLNISQSSIIIVRDKQRKLRAFANSCRHRGSQLLEGEGRCRTISCPFHSWTYNLEGKLIGAAKMETVKNFDKTTQGLKEFALEERAGFMFVCLSDSPQSIDGYLGDFEGIHNPWAFGSLKSTRHRTFEVDCNWKVFLDVFNEHYHLPFVHPDSVNDLYDPPHAADQTTGAYASQFGETSGTGGLLQNQQKHALPAMPNLPEHVTNGVRYTWVYPNMTFAIGVDMLWIYETYPLGANRCEVHQTVCFPTATIESSNFTENVKFYYHRLDAAIAEDIPALERQQRGLSSVFAQAGRFSPLLEANVASFAKWYAEQMQTQQNISAN